MEQDSLDVHVNCWIGWIYRAYPLLSWTSIRILRGHLQCNKTEWLLCLPHAIRATVRDNQASQHLFRGYRSLQLRLAHTMMINKSPEHSGIAYMHNGKEIKLLMLENEKAMRTANVIYFRKFYCKITYLGFILIEQFSDSFGIIDK